MIDYVHVLGRLFPRQFSRAYTGGSSVFRSVPRPRYGLDGPGMESRWEAKIPAPVWTCPGAHPASCTMGFFPGGKAAGAWR